MRFVWSIALAAALAAQKPPEPEQIPTIKVEVDVVNILCTVRNKSGGLVKDLTQDDFEVFEDGKRQVIKYFSRETDLPLTIGLLVDVSVSQRNLIEIEKQAASQFFSQVLRAKDLAFLISFGSDAELLQDLTSSPRLLRAALDELRVKSDVSGLHPGPVPTMSKPRGTVLFDAVYLAATEKLSQEVGRKAIVLITDGVDMGSRLKLPDALAAAHKADTIIYSVHYFDPSAYRGLFYGVSDSDLKRMSEETGGGLFRVSKRNPLPAIFDQIQQEMRSQYAIGYTPANSTRDGGFRRVEIKSRQKDLKVQARQGYFQFR